MPDEAADLSGSAYCQERAPGGAEGSRVHREGKFRGTFTYFILQIHGQLVFRQDAPAKSCDKFTR